jgi:Na+-driven multidrug efflux pump
VTYLGMMILTGVFARLGTADLAAYGLGTRLDFILLTFVFGFGSAVLTLVAMAVGARRGELVTTYVWQASRIVVVLLAIPSVVLWWHPEGWLCLFTDDPAVLDVGRSYFRIVGPSYPFLGVAMLTSFAFQGLGRAAVPLVWMLVRVTAVVGSAVAGTRWFGWGPLGCFAAIALGNVASAVAMTWLLRRAMRRPALSG